MPTAAPPANGPEDLLDRLRDAIELLESIVADASMLDALPDEQRIRLRRAITGLYSPDRAERRRLAKAAARDRKAARVRQAEGVRAETGIRALRRRPVVHSPNVFPPEHVEPDALDDLREGGTEPATSAGPHRAAARPTGAPEPQHCYVCKQHYSVIHHFYDQLCPGCAERNFAKRTELADLRGRVALLTGGRVKIGYQAALKLLRSGAHVIVTTRFPRNAAMRYAGERDFAAWADRLEIVGLDLRHTPGVEAFCREMLATRTRLDFIVNNACQTVRRPPEFYAHMMAGERAAIAAMPDDVRRLLGSDEGLTRPVPALGDAAQLSQVPLLPEELTARTDLFPEGRLDRDLQQVDLRPRNSWRLLLDEVPTLELLEVQLVNAVAPFVLNARLKALLLRTPERDKHIVNVSAVEGQFYRTFKTTRHPHTNMAKAALNMMTRTSAAEYHGDGIHMNSVDTGWITDEDPVEIAARKTVEQRFHPPLDSVDGAARILDPIITGFNTGRHVWGLFLKDYEPTDW